MFVFVRMRGNRFWLKLGSAICGISMLILGECFIFEYPNKRHMTDHLPYAAYFVRRASISTAPSNGLSLGGLVSVLMVYIFAFSFGVSLGPISWNVCSEIFPLHINAKCCAITTCTQWLFQVRYESLYICLSHTNPLARSSLPA
jgi:hypothetical protein